KEPSRYLGLVKFVAASFILLIVRLCRGNCKALCSIPSILGEAIKALDELVEWCGGLPGLRPQIQNPWRLLVVKAGGVAVTSIRFERLGMVVERVEATRDAMTFGW
ncbi:hypothetical protein BKA70DRAFT_1313972, partial [Coprinopsis sp. MPI-PUGE-AT-0042]